MKSIQEVQKEIIVGDMSRLYIFTGEEPALMNIYINKICEKIGGKTLAGEDILKRLKIGSLTSERTCYVLRDEKFILTDEKLWDELIEASIHGRNFIILAFSTPLDKRGKFYKHFKDSYITEFEKMPTDLIVKYIRKDFPDLEEYDARTISKICLDDYGKVLLELDKLKNLKEIYSDKTYEQIIESFGDKVLIRYYDEVIFKFIELICKRITQPAFSTAEYLREKGESPLGIITLLYNTFRSMLLIKAAGQCSDLTARTGLTSFQVHYAKEYLRARDYSVEKLIQIIKFIREIEKGIKTGLVDSLDALELILIEVWS